MHREEATLIARQAAEQAADNAVSTVFLRLGINIEDPNQVVEFQKDFNAMRDFIRTWRTVRSQGIVALTLLLLTAAIGAFWVGVKASFR